MEAGRLATFGGGGTPPAFGGVVMIKSCHVTMGLVGMVALLGARTADAIALPDSSTCSSGVCFTIKNTLSQGFAIQGVASGGSAARGITGEATTGFGVLGTATTSGTGVAGSSDSANGVMGFTNSSSAAAISALAPTSAGLAYYGTGGITISGSAQKPGGGPWAATSDIRLKKDVSDLKWGLDQIRQVRPVTYKYNGLGATEDDGRVFVGVIAQDLEKVMPMMVSSKKQKLRPTDAAETDIKVVDPNAFTYVLINAVKEQQNIIEQQERRIASLERDRRSALSASAVGSGFGLLAIGLAPLAWIALRRKAGSQRIAGG